jgi:hypothetical protein
LLLRRRRRDADAQHQGGYRRVIAHDTRRQPSYGRRVIIRDPGSGVRGPNGQIPSSKHQICERAG